MSDLHGYIYLLQDAEYSDSDVYKVGRTLQKKDTRRLTRLTSYSYGTVVHLLEYVPHSGLNLAESEILARFGRAFRLVKGREWFAGDLNSMKSIIRDVVGTYSETSDVVDVPAESEYETVTLRPKGKKTLHMCETSRTSTTEKANLVRHCNRTLPCKKHVEATKENAQVIPVVVPERVNPLQCTKCKKVFSSKHWYLNHVEKTCKGFPSNQCGVCLKVFASANKRSKHNRLVNCSPPESLQASTSNAVTSIGSHYDAMFVDHEAKQAYLADLLHIMSLAENLSEVMVPTLMANVEKAIKLVEGNGNHKELAIILSDMR